MSSEDKDSRGKHNVICRGSGSRQGDLFPRTVHNASDHPVKVENVQEFEKLCKNQELDHGLLHRVGRRRKKKDHQYVRRFKYSEEKGRVVEIE